MKKGLVSVIIINWNGKQYLEKCLTSLYKQDYQNIEVIFVDNASKDDSVSYVKKKFPKAIVIINTDNFGFAEGNNVGYRVAHGEYILFLNNDTDVKNNFVTEMVKGISQSPEIGGAQGKILLMDEQDKLDSVGAFLTGTGLLYHYGAGKKDIEKYDKELYLYSAKGACMIFKKSVLQAIEVDGDILDSRYFCYFEETDMCHRVWLAGYKIIYIPTSIIYHKLGGTSTRLNNAFVQYHSFKNRINSYIKNLDIINLIKILPVHLLICEGFAFLALAQRNLKLFTAIHKAYYWNVQNFSQTIRKRTYIQKKIRKLSDAKIYPYIFKNVGLDYYLDMPHALVNYTDKEITNIFHANKITHEKDKK